LRCDSETYSQQSKCCTFRSFTPCCICYITCASQLTRLCGLLSRAFSTLHHLSGFGWPCHLIGHPAFHAAFIFYAPLVTPVPQRTPHATLFACCSLRQIERAMPLIRLHGRCAIHRSHVASHYDRHMLPTQVGVPSIRAPQIHPDQPTTACSPPTVNADLPPPRPQSRPRPPPPPRPQPRRPFGMSSSSSLLWKANTFLGTSF